MAQEELSSDSTHFLTLFSILPSRWRGEETDGTRDHEAVSSPGLLHRRAAMPRVSVVPPLSLACWAGCKRATRAEVARPDG